MTIKEGSERFAQALLIPINPVLIILLGGFTVVWGLWVASPWWTVFTHAPLYSVLASVAPEWAWGTLAIVAGCITIYGAVTRRYGPLTRGAAIAGGHWFIISILYFLGDAASTGGITALIFAIYAAVVYLNIKVNFKGDPRMMNKIPTPKD